MRVGETYSGERRGFYHPIDRGADRGAQQESGSILPIVAFLFAATTIMLIRFLAALLSPAQFLFAKRKGLYNLHLNLWRI